MFSMSIQFQDEDTKNKTFGLQCLIGENETLKDGIINRLLHEILVDMQGAYLEEVLVKSGLVKMLQIDIYGINKVFHFRSLCTNSQRDNLDKFKEIIDTTLEKVVKDGIEKEKLLAGLNRIEFSVRELLNSTTAGIEYFIGIFDSWLYGKNPMNSLIFDETLLNLEMIF